MAGWYARLLFEGDRLIDAGTHDVLPPAVGVRPAALDATPEELLTSVIVSGYALYGRIRGYYAVGVGRLRLGPDGRPAFLSEADERHAESAARLTPGQRAELAGWLEGLSPAAWSDSLHGFRRQLCADAAARHSTSPHPLEIA
jgi:hypothetical protein